MAYFKICEYFPGIIEENHEKPQPVQPASTPIIEASLREIGLNRRNDRMLVL